MQYYRPTQDYIYWKDEAGFVQPLKVCSPFQRQWYLAKYFQRPRYDPLRVRCNNIIHGGCVPRVR